MMWYSLRFFKAQMEVAYIVGVLRQALQVRWDEV